LTPECPIQADTNLTEYGTANITTEAGSTNTIGFAPNCGATTTINSAGTDTITLSSLYDNVTMSGNSTLNALGDNYGSVTLNGHETVNTLDGAAWTIGSTANATINSQSGGESFTKTAGATVNYNVDHSQYNYDFGGNVTMAGGADAVAFSNLNLGVTAQDAAADTFTYHGGSAKIVGGSGADTYVVQQSTRTGTLEIQGFKPGTDHIGFAGFAGVAVTSTGVNNGNTVLGLADGATVQVDGVGLTPADYGPAPVPTPQPTPVSAPAPAPAPAAGPDTIVVNASASLAAGVGVGAHFNLVVDGAKVGSATVGGTSTQAYSFNTTLAGGMNAAHDIQVQFDNDAVVGGQDRNLYLQSIAVGGQATAAIDKSEVYHATGTAASGFGPGDIASSGNMYWQGAAEFRLPAASMPAPAPPPLASVPLQAVDTTLGHCQTRFLHGTGQLPTARNDLGKR